MLLLGRSRSGVSFRNVFSTLVALSLGAVLRLSNITPGESDARVVGRNRRWKRDDKKTLKTILSAVLSHLKLGIHFRQRQAEAWHGSLSSASVNSALSRAACLRGGHDPSHCVLIDQSQGV